MNRTDTVYLTGRNYERIGHALDALGCTMAMVRGEVLDVAHPDAAAHSPGNYVAVTAESMSSSTTRSCA